MDRRDLAASRPAPPEDPATHPLPIDLLTAWPADRGLAAMLSSGDGDRARWSLLAEPDFVTCVHLDAEDDPVAALRAHLAAPADEPPMSAPRRVRRSGTGAAADADNEPETETEIGRGREVESPAPLADPTDPIDSPSPPPPWIRGWIAAFSYDLGRRIEPAVDRPSAGTRDREGDRARAADDRNWPDVVLARVTRGLAFDHVAGQWWAIGDVDERLCTEPRAAPADRDAPGDPGYAIDLDRAVSSLDDDAHAAAVADTREAIARGDFFQANVTRRWTAPFRGDVRHLAAAAMAAARPRYGALLELPGRRAVVSMSPELFLELDPVARTIRSRPIKGTRPAESGARSDGPAATELMASAKDAAELVMIIDLMRNDLGRISDPGTVRVARGRHVETHETVHHGVADVTGHLRAGVDAADVIAATFPPGSITGAPKIEAMRHLDRLEPVRRGAYCGAIGWIGDGGAMQLNVAIRTMVTGPTRSDPAGDLQLDYGAGGGIVADSDPYAEVREADDKTAVLRRVAARGRPAEQNSAPRPG